MGLQSPKLAEVARQDGRYAVEAYEFLHHAMAFTLRMLGYADQGESKSSPPKLQHVSAAQLCEGVRQFAREQFGMMAYVVFKAWGVYTTADIGRMVYRLIDAGLWHCSPTDRPEDFDDLYDFAQVFLREFHVEWDEL